MDEEFQSPPGKEQVDDSHHEGRHNGQRNKRFRSGFAKFPKRLAAVLVLLGVFYLGALYGSGNLSRGNFMSLFRKDFTPVSGLPEDLDYKSVEEIYDTLRSNYDGKLTEQQMLDGLKAGLANATGDPYTEYFTADKAKKFNQQLTNSFSGIGAELGKDKDDNLIIVAPISGYPAERAGLKAQDIIATINGESTTGISIEEAVGKIRGEKGTEVTLQVIRNKATSHKYTITRETIKVDSVKTEELDGNIGYIRITNFADDTTDLVIKAAEDFKSKKVKGIILDLRSNPGGLLDQSVDVSGVWLPSGKTVLQEKRGGKVVVNTYTSSGPATLEGVPTVVLLDEGSASASEIVAGALKDNGAAYLIGVKTYGKGVVQQTICITGTRQADGGCSTDMLKVTIASWYTPDGKHINKEGIKPDREVKIS
jgi:carboxyl-terminal processing protease